MIRILVADDHQLLRQALVSQLSEVADFSVVGEARDGRAAVQLVGELEPDVVLMDVGMPVLSGIAATAKIVAVHPATRVAILSMHSERRFVSEALSAGAIAYIIKDTSVEELVAAIRAAAMGERYLSPGLDPVALDGGAAGATSPLTQREREVLQLIAEGRSTKEVAAELGLSPKTVETHRQNIMNKTNTYSATGLVRYALREGIASLEP